MAVSRSLRLVLLAAVLLAAFFRCSSLDATGFAEDEIDIVRAVDAYRHLDFSANAEHPMLAKLAAFGAVESASAWNAVAGLTSAPRISLEWATRFPSALVGGVLTTLVIFLLCRELFPDIRIAVWASLLWALDVNATGVNRTAKGAAFVSANFAVFLPSIWKRLSVYLSGHTPIHTGYLFAHTLYVNSIVVTPGGPPPSFDVAFLALKVPILGLSSFLAGLFLMVRRRGDRGFVFARYMLPLLAVVDIVAAAGIVWVLDAARARVQPARCVRI